MSKGRVLIIGIDGFIGFALAQHLLHHGFDVVGADNLFRRNVVQSLDSQSVTPIAPIETRLAALETTYGKKVPFIKCDVINWEAMLELLRKFKPEAVVYLAHQPSAPFSMKDHKSSLKTTINNVLGPLNLVWALKELKMQKDTHVIVIGTLGEYFHSNIPIPEKGLKITYNSIEDILPYPRKGISFYHNSKVLGSLNFELACNCYELAVTDVMQGVIFGVITDEVTGENEDLFTRFDVDEVFGTVINRFCAEAVAKQYGLSVYGSGNQLRGFLPLRDSVQCLRLLIENPPRRGEYRQVNQYAEVYRIEDLARTVKRIYTEEYDTKVKIRYFKNPRVENEEVRVYKVERGVLDSLGYKPSITLEQEIKNTLQILIKYRKRIPTKKLKPTITWQG